jgi:Tfp pilus assembly protein PilE
MKHTRYNKQGFTIIEAIVATAVFAFVVTSIMGVYESTLRLDTRTRAQRNVIQNSQFIMQFLEKEITNGHIDYAKTPCGPNAGANHDLYIINQEGEAEHMYLSGTDLLLCKNGTITDLNSSTIQISSLGLYVSPATDPLTNSAISNGPNLQPHVTVSLEVQSVATRDRSTLNLQSTFSELYYPSRQ